MSTVHAARLFSPLRAPATSAGGERPHKKRRVGGRVVYDDDPSMGVQDLATFCAAHARSIARLHAQSGADRWALPRDAFAEALHRSAAHRFPDGAAEAEIARYLSTLHVEDLALACACRAGHGAAWDHLVLEYRPALYAAARSVAGDAHRDLADSLVFHGNGNDVKAVLCWGKGAGDG